MHVKSDDFPIWLSSMNLEPRRVICLITFEVTQLLRPLYLSVTDGRTDGRTDSLRGKCAVPYGIYKAIR